MVLILLSPFQGVDLFTRNRVELKKLQMPLKNEDILTKHVSLETLLRHLHAVGLMDRQRQTLKQKDRHVSPTVRVSNNVQHA